MVYFVFIVTRDGKVVYANEILRHNPLNLRYWYSDDWAWLTTENLELVTFNVILSQIHLPPSARHGNKNNPNLRSEDMKTNNHNTVNADCPMPYRRNVGTPVPHAVGLAFLALRYAKLQAY